MLVKGSAWPEFSEKYSLVQIYEVISVLAILLYASNFSNVFIWYTKFITSIGIVYI